MELQTSRLCLQPLEPKHAEQLFFGLQDERLYEFIPDTPPSGVTALCERYAALARRQSPDGTEYWLNWAIWLPIERRYIGYAQATVNADRSGATLAYVLFRDAWGQGFAREATRRVIEYLGEVYRIGEFRAYVDVRNRRSINLLESLGFVRVGIRMNALKGLISWEAEYLKTDGTGEE